MYSPSSLSSSSLSSVSPFKPPSSPSPTVDQWQQALHSFFSPSPSSPLPPFILAEFPASPPSSDMRQATEHAQFLCLSYVVKYFNPCYTHMLSPSARAHIRSSLLLSIRDLFPAIPRSFSIKNKLGVLLVLFAQHDYPDDWRSFFDEFLSVIASTGNADVMDLFFKMLKVLEEEVVQFDEKRTQEEVVRNTRIKDQMRTGSTLSSIADLAFSILHSFASSRPSLCIQTLESMKELIGWIDIWLVANTRFLSLFYTFVSSPSSPLAVPAAACLQEIIKKRMKPEEKLSLLHSTQIIPFLQQLPHSGQQKEEWLEALAELIDTLSIELIDLFPASRCAMFEGGAGSSSVLSSTHSLSSTPSSTSSFASSSSSSSSSSPSLTPFCLQLLEALDASLSLGYPFLSHSSFTIAHECLDSYIQYVKLVASMKELFSHPYFSPPPSSSSPFASPEVHFPRIFSLAARGLRYPSSYSFSPSDQGDYEQEYDAFHSDLALLLTQMTKGRQSLVLRATADLVREVMEGGAGGRGEQEVQAALFIFYDIGPAVKVELLQGGEGGGGGEMRGGGLAQCADFEPFRSILRSLFLSPPLPIAPPSSSSSSPSSSPSITFPPLSTTFINIIHRYAKFLESNPSFLPHVFEALLSSSCLSSPFPAARSRASYVLFFILRSWPSSSRSLLRPFAPSLLSRIEPLIRPVIAESGVLLTNSRAAQEATGKRGMLALEDVNYLCEGVGMLLASAVTGPECGRVTGEVMGWFDGQMRETLEKIKAIGRNTSSTSASPSSSSSSPSSPSSSSSFSLDLERLIAQQSCLIDCVANISKSLTRDGPSLSPLFSSLSLTVLDVFAAAPAAPLLRQKVTFFCHRLIECMGERLLSLPFLPQVLPLFLSFSTTAADIEAVLTLFNQLVVKYKGAFGELIAAHWGPLCQRVFSVIQSYSYIDEQGANGPSSSSASAAFSTQRAERKAIQKGFFVLFKSIATNSLLPSVLSPSLAPLLPSLLSSLLSSTLSDDASLVKTSFVLLRSLLRPLRQVLSPDDYFSFISSQLTPALWGRLLGCKYDYSDADSLAAAREGIELQRDAIKAVGEGGGGEEQMRYVTYLGQSLMRDGGMRGDQVDVFLKLLEANDTQKIVTAFAQMNKERHG